jgi:hypothetical protein
MGINYEFIHSLRGNSYINEEKSDGVRTTGQKADSYQNSLSYELLSLPSLKIL